jgi:CheY-like chemotaxis protein
MGDALRTVLIVDDEPQVLRLVEHMLRSRRIHLLFAPHAAGALEICKREPVHVLISDVNMPGMDGATLAERVLALHPEASVLMISGYAKEAPPLGKASQVRFLRKPFFPSELIERLMEMLPEA